MELVDLVNSVMIFLSQMTLLRCLTFLLESMTVALAILLFWIYFLWRYYLFYNGFPSIGKFWYCWLSFLWISKNSKQDATFHRIAYDYSRADWDGPRDHLKDVPWGDIIKLSASANASELCEWVQVGINVYISHRKYQIKPQSSSWFPEACTAVIIHRNHFFCLNPNQQNSNAM